MTIVFRAGDPAMLKQVKRVGRFASGRAGASYQPGEPNVGAIQAWNAASVYQRAIALIAPRSTVEGARL